MATHAATPQLMETLNNFLPLELTELGTNVPESEDGGSLLGSSRKSLADTSVTSTADLSVFSGGQRSQQAYDICVDDNRSLSEDEAENQSSSG